MAATNNQSTGAPTAPGAIAPATSRKARPEAADHQLHVVLEQILDGIAIMKADKGRDQGAVKIVQALDQYGTHFDHAGWKPLKH